MSELIPCPPPGVYRNAKAEYYSWDALSNTQLGWLKENPARYKHLLANPEDPTPAMEVGKKLHSMTLDGEPNPYPATCTNKTDAKAKRDLDGMHAALLADPLVSRMLRKTTPDNRELAIVWRDNETGVLCKALLDAVFPYRAQDGTTKFCVWDLKKTNDASPEGFQSSFYKYGYHRQCAHYWEGGLSVPLDVGMFVFAAVEQTPPYPVICYEVEEEARLMGKWERYRLIQKFVRCQETGEFPGYSDGRQFHKLTLPSWAKKEIEAL